MNEDPNVFDVLCWTIGCAVVITVLLQSILN